MTKKIIISESVEEIGSMAFGLCYKLVDIYNFSKVEIDELEKKYTEQYGCEIVEMYADIVSELKELPTECER